MLNTDDVIFSFTSVALITAIRASASFLKHAARRNKYDFPTVGKQNSQSGFLENNLMHHEMTHTLEIRSGIKGLKLIRLRVRSEPVTWSNSSPEEAAETKLQSGVSKMQAEFHMV